MGCTFQFFAKHVSRLVRLLGFVHQDLLALSILAGRAARVTLVVHAYALLPIEGYATKFQLYRQRFLINAFKIPRPLYPMNLNCRANLSIFSPVSLLIVCPPWRLGGFLLS